MKLTVSKKLNAVFLGIFLCFWVMNYLSYSAITNMQKTTREIGTDLLPSIQTVGDINFITEHVFALELKHILATDEASKNAFENELNLTIKDLNQKISDTGSLLSSDSEKQTFEKFKSEWANFISVYNQTLLLSNQFKTQEAEDLLATNELSFNKMQVVLNELIQINETKKTQSLEVSDAAGTKAIYMIAGSFFLILFIIIGAVFMIKKNISKPLSSISEHVTRVAAGDFTVQPIAIKNRDEIGELSNHFNNMVDDLKKLIRDIVEKSQQVSSTSEELAASADETTRTIEQISVSMEEIASGSNEHLRNIEQSKDSVFEISKGMKEISESVQTMTDSSIQATDKAVEGKQKLEEVVTQMNAIRESANSSWNAVDLLGEKSGEIGKVVEMITNFTKQTNLLSLNAGIEAARAGEHGKGFSVVASEIRKLADQSNLATNQISEIIEEIQREIKMAITKMSEGNQRVNEGQVLIHEVSENFNVIISSINEVSEQAQEIAATVEQTTAGSQTIADSMEHVANISQESTANTQEVAASVEETNATMEGIATAANELSTIAEELQHSVEKFKI